MRRNSSQWSKIIAFFLLLRVQEFVWNTFDMKEILKKTWVDCRRASVPCERRVYEDQFQSLGERFMTANGR